MSLLAGVNGTFPSFACANLNASPAQVLPNNTTVTNTTATNTFQQHNPNTSTMVNAAPANPVGLSSRAVGSGKRYRGVVVYYTTSKGFGFAHTEKPEMWKIYVHIYALEKCGVADLEVGMELEFNVRENHKGKYACNVCPVLRNGAGQVVERDVIPVAIPMFEGRHRGTLKSFDSQRLFGWVMCGDTEVFMTIYELRHDNMEQHLVQGTVLDFTVGKHGRGLTAYDIEVVQSAAVVAQQMPQMAPCVALPLGSVAPSLIQPGVQPLTPEQINALIAATLLNTQAWSFLPLTQQQQQTPNHQITSAMMSPSPTPNPILLQTQQSVGCGVGGDENANTNAFTNGLHAMMMGLSAQSFQPHAVQQLFASATMSDQQQQQGQQQGPKSPLLRLPSMSTHSPLLDRTNRLNSNHNSMGGGAFGWDDMTMNGCERKSSLSMLFDGTGSNNNGGGLDASAWASAVLV